MNPLAASFDRFRQQGDLLALGEVFDALAPRLLSVAMHLCGNAADAEDVLQQTFLLAMQKAESFDPTRPVEPWFAGLLTNVARNARRHAGRRRTEPLLDLAIEGEAPLAAAERAELLGQLREKIDDLPVEQRQVLLLQLQHGLGPAAIAEVLQVPPGTVRMRLHRGLQALRRSLPAGLAGLASLSLPESGLAAVRQSVLQAGARFVPLAAMGTTTAGVSLLGGAVLMKKVICVVLAMLFLGLGWWFRDGVPQSLAAGPSAPAAAQVAEADVVVPDTGTPPQRDPVAVLQPPSGDAPGSLHIEVVAAPLPGTDAAEQLPVAGALLRIWPGSAPLAPFGELTRMLVSDATGRVDISELAVGPWQVQLLADGDPAVAVLVGSGAPTELKLVRATIECVSGIVVDPAGIPVPGAAIWVHRGTGLGAYGLVEPKALEVRRAGLTDSAGRFHIAIGARESGVGATAPGFAASYSQHPATKGHEVRLVLGREHGTLQGVVRNESGQPVAGAIVEVVPWGQDSHRAADGSSLGARVPMQAYSDARGCFVFEGLPVGTTKYWASLEPYYPGWGQAALVGGSTLVDIVLKNGICVVGSVHLADGAPARVSMAARPRLDPNGHYTECDTREDGSYRLDWVPARDFFVTVGRQGIVAHREFRSPSPGLLQCDFVLEDLVALRGRVVGPDGAPLPKWRVAAFAGAQASSAGTSGDGSFVLTVSRGSVLRIVAAPQDGDVHTPVVVRDGVRPEGNEIVLQVDANAMPTASLRGRLVDSKGQPIADHGLSLGFEKYSTAHNRVATTGVDGTFSFGGLSPLAFELRLAGADSDSTPIAKPLAIAGQVVDLGDCVVPTTGSLRVSVLSANGATWSGPLPWLQLRSIAGQVVRGTQRHEDNVIEVQVQPGAYTLEIVGADLTAIPLPVQVVEGERRETSIRVAIGRTRELVCNGDGSDKLESGMKLHVIVRTVSGDVIEECESADLMPDLRGFRYGLLRRTFPFGDYTVEAQTNTGLRYQGKFTVREDLEDPVRVDIPLVR